MPRSIFGRLTVSAQNQGSLAALFAIATTLMLEATRAFVSYLVFVLDQSQRQTIGLVALLVFAFPVSCWIIARFTGLVRLFSGSILILATSRLALQFIEHPGIRLITSGASMIAWGILAVVLLASCRRTAGIGLIFGFALDLSVRTAGGALDVLWIPDGLNSAFVTCLIVLMIALWWFGRRLVVPGGTTWSGAGALVVVGPSIALYHLITGNIAWVSIQTGLSATESAALLAGGLMFGALIAALRLLAMNTGAGGGALIARFILFDAVIGAITLSLAWGGEELALLGVLFSAVTLTELLLFAVAAGGAGTRSAIGPVAIFLTFGLLVQFVLLFLYYSATGSGQMIGFGWIILVVGTFLSAHGTATSPSRSPGAIRSLAPTAFIVVLLLVSSIAWSAFQRSPIESEPASANELRVMTYNIQSGFSRDNYWDIRATADVINSSEADIVVLQEVSRGWLVATGNDQLRWLSEYLQMPYAWGPASTDNLWGNAILSRYPIVSSSVTKYDSTQNLRRSALVVELDLGDQSVINVVATHLDNPENASDARSEQVEQLISFLNGEHETILAGDFNMQPTDPLITRVLDHGFEDAAAIGGATAGTSEDGRRIDYVFASHGFQVVDATVIDTNASDHRPVYVELTLK